MMAERSLEIVLDALAHKIALLESDLYLKGAENKRLREENERLSAEAAKLEKLLAVMDNG